MGWRGNIAAKICRIHKLENNAKIKSSFQQKGISVNHKTFANICFSKNPVLLHGDIIMLDWNGTNKIALKEIGS